MAQISLSKLENNILREILLCSIRHYTREIKTDESLLSTCKDGDEMKDLYENMLYRDRSFLKSSKKLYLRLLDVCNDDDDPEYFPNFCND